MLRRHATCQPHRRTFPGFRPLRLTFDKETGGGERTRPVFSIIHFQNSELIETRTRNHSSWGLHSYGWSRHPAFQAVSPRAGVGTEMKAPATDAEHHCAEGARFFTNPVFSPYTHHTWRIINY